MWSEKQLRWFADDENFDADPWWEEVDEDGNRKKKTVDMGNPELTVLQEGARRKLRPEPFLWELLRRHPELPLLKKKFGCLSDTEEHDQCKELKQAWCLRWQDKGANSVGALLKFGETSWAKLGAEQYAFKSGLQKFCETEENFESGKSFDYSYPVLVVAPHLPKISDELALRIGFGAPFHSDSISFAEESELKKGRKLFLLSIDPTASRKVLKTDVWAEVESWLDGKSKRENPWWVWADKKSRLEKKDAGSSRESKYVKQSGIIRATEKKLIGLEMLSLSEKLSFNHRRSISDAFSDFRLT